MDRSTRFARLSTSLDWRTLVVTLAALAVGLLLVACGDDDEDGEEDASQQPAQATVATFNAGLIDGYVPLTRERQPAVVSAVADSDFDVMCMQEVWAVGDVEAIIDAEGTPYAHDYWVDSTQDIMPPQCTNEDLDDLLGCVTENECETDPEGLSACGVANCTPEIGRLSSSNEPCWLCIVSQLGVDPTVDNIRHTCVEVGSYEYSAEGRNGLVLLSEHPMTLTESLELNSYITLRYVLHAQIDLPAVGATDVYCTHLTTRQSVPYFGDSESWEAENAAQITTTMEWIDETASTGQVIFMGDFNTGPETASWTGEDPENYALIPAAGYQSAYFAESADPPCTFCESNTLRTGADEREGKIIDHIFLSGFDGVAVTAQRIFDETVEITTDDGPQQSNISDHFGVAVTLTK